MAKHAEFEADKKQQVGDAEAELHDAAVLYEADRKKLLADIGGFTKKYVKTLPDKDDKQHNAREAYDPIAESVRSLIR